MKKTREIIVEWLRLNGYDGLCNVDQECGCAFDDELAPCECINLDECRPAVKGPCTCGGECFYDMFIKESDLKVV